MSHPTEGVIKFNLQFTPAPAVNREELREIEAWRTILRRLAMVGQDPLRYEGFGFGNLSRRLEPWDAPPEERPFLITGTQTGGQLKLGPEGYAVVTGFRLQRNEVFAEGPLRPSSESLTHGALYEVDSRIHWVFHAHSPEIWQHAELLGLAVTPKDVPYGTPELARTVKQMLGDPAVFRQGLLVIGGHEDGIFSFGRTAGEAGEVLLHALAKALAFEDSMN